MKEQENCLQSQKVSAETDRQTAHYSQLTVPTSLTGKQSHGQLLRDELKHEQHSPSPRWPPAPLRCGSFHLTAQVMPQLQQNPSLERELIQRGTLLHSEMLESPSCVLATTTVSICPSGFPSCSNTSGFSKIMVFPHCVLQKRTVIKGLITNGPAVSAFCLMGSY